jgi:two-component system, sensor histidine kinase and response regulator
MKQTKILIVDDRPENIFTLESILNEDHRTFLNATSGMEALLMAKLEPIDLILLDYHLDDMTGLDVARKLREDEVTKNISIIFVTALNKSERKKLNEFEHGTVDFIFKPLDMEETQTKVFIFERISLLQRELMEKVKQTS